VAALAHRRTTLLLVEGSHLPTVCLVECSKVMVVRFSSFNSKFYPALFSTKWSHPAESKLFLSCADLKQVSLAVELSCAATL
jgi:hypothetical protein